MNGKRDWGWVLLLFALVAIFGLAKGCSSATTPAGPPRDPLAVLNEAFFSHPICWGPVLVALVPLAVWGSVRLYFWVLNAWLHAQRLRIEIAQIQTAVTGPQVVTDRQGQMVLVNPRLATRAVTPVAADAPADSEQLRGVALIASALRRGATIPPAVGSLAADTAAPEETPIQVRVLPPADLRHILGEVRPKLAALAVREEGTDD